MIGFSVCGKKKKEPDSFVTVNHPVSHVVDKYSNCVKDYICLLFLIPIATYFN